MSIFVSLFGLGNQELFLISIGILFYSFVIWSVIDLFSNKDLGANPKITLGDCNSFLSISRNTDLLIFREVSEAFVNQR